MVASFFRMLTALLLVLAAAAQPTDVKSPLLKVPLLKRVSTGPNNLVKHNQLRVHSLRAKAEGRDVSLPQAGISSPVTNQGVAYTASVGVGSPATQCK
jgi:cathepsin E